MKTYMVKEVFGPTIQGEGSWAGTAVMFVRFSGCNQWDGRKETKATSACPFCDTDFRGGDRLTKQEIVQKLKELQTAAGTDTGVVVLSGGEPMLQVDDELLQMFRKLGYSIHIETNGTRPVSQLAHHVTVSPKVPANQIKATGISDLKMLWPPIHPEITPEHFKGINAGNRFLQPVMDDNYESNVNSAVQFILKNPSWRLSLQTHKIIGVQ